jgi:hypothetical protein
MRIASYFILLIFASLSLYGQGVTGGSGMCITDANPNTIANLDTQNEDFDCLKVYDKTNNKFYYYDASLSAGSRWVEYVPGSGSGSGGTTSNYDIRLTLDSSFLVFDDGVTHWRMGGGYTYNGYTYIAYIVGAMNNADIKVTRINNETYEADAPVTIETNINTADPEDHSAPSLIVLENNPSINGSIVIAFQSGNVNGSRVYLSDSPEDISSFSAVLSTNYDYIYPNIVEVSNGDVLMFNRNSGVGSDLTFTRCTNIEAVSPTWSAQTTLVDSDVYSQVAVKGDTIQLMCNQRVVSSPNYFDDIYTARSLDGGVTWQTMGGGSLTLPLTVNVMDLVFDRGTNSNTRDADVALDENGSPVFLFVREVNPFDKAPTDENSQSTFTYAYYDNGTWIIEDIARGVSMGTQGQESYGSINPMNTNEVFLSVFNKSRAEVQKWDRADGNWEKICVYPTHTADRFNGDNIRPIGIKNNDGKLEVYYSYVEGWTGTNRFGTFSELVVPLRDFYVVDAQTVNGIEIVNPTIPAIQLPQIGFNPPKIDTGSVNIFLSDGNATGDDGDLMAVINDGTNENYYKIIDKDQPQNFYDIFLDSIAALRTEIENIVAGNQTSSISFIDSLNALNADSIYAQGYIVAMNGASVTDRGFVYSTGSNPTLADSKLSVGSGTGQIIDTITGLAASTTYYIRAFAITDYDTSYSSVLSATTMGSGGAPFAPDDITGLVGWYDGADTDGDGTENEEISMGNWIDKSATGNDLFNYNGASLNTTGLNSNYTVEFTGSQYFGGSALTALDADSNYTIIIVSKSDLDNTFQALLTTESDASGARVQFFHDSRTTARLFSSNSAWYLDRSADIGTSWIYTYVTKDGTTYQAYEDGAAQNSTTQALYGANTDLVIGAQSSSTNLGLDGQIAEVLIYNKVLNSSELTDINNYIGTKWGL